MTSTVAVLGVGGVGGMLATRLTAAGHRAVCVATPASAAAIRSAGIELEAPDGALRARPEVVEHLEEPVGLLVVAVKAPALAEALERIEVFAVADGVALTLLNGLEHPEIVRRRLGPRVAPGSISHFQAHAVAPGRVVQETGVPLVTAASDDLPSDMLDRALAPLREAGVDVVLSDDERAVLWDKAARLAPLAAATAASGLTVGELRSRSGLACAAGGRGRRGRRGGRRRRHRHDTCDAVDDDRRHARHPDHVGGSRRRRRASLRARRHRRVGAAGRRPARRRVPRACSACRGGGRVTTAIALIGARSGSERVPGKNVRPLAGHPLLAYAIATARQAGVFDRVVVSTDSEAIAEVARWYGADVPFLRPAEYATATSPDIEWIADLLGKLPEQYDVFAIVRATNPFRGPDVIRRGLEQLIATPEADSIRAVELVKQHPGKMWTLDEGGRLMHPVLDQSHLDIAWHAGQYQALPRVHVQNSALEIAWTRVVTETGTREGLVLAPFLTQGYEGFNVDDEDDWARAEALLSAGRATLPQVDAEPYAAESA